MAKLLSLGALHELRRALEEGMMPPCRAFLLAAGMGTRLKPLTNKIPKCLLPIGDKPLLQIWLENLAQHGIDEVLINTHWFAGKVEKFLQQSQLNLRVITSYEPELLGSGGTILANREWVEDGAPFFMLYGDNLTKVNLGKMWGFHREHGLPFTLGVFKADNPSQCGIAEVREDGLVTGFVEKPEHPRSNLAAAGIYIADQRIFEAFPVLGNNGNASFPRPLDLGFHVIPHLVGRMKAYFIEEFLMDIGNPESYRRAQELWEEAEHE
jgi:mannose-1-phosphate guanylyltransferase